MGFREELMMYQPEMVSDSLYQVLRFGDEFLADLSNYRKWLEKHSTGDQTGWFELLAAKDSQKCVALIKSVEQLDLLYEYAQAVWAVYNERVLPEKYQTLLDELCVEKYTWRYLAATKYLSHNMIASLKKQSLDYLRRLVMEDEG